MSSEDNARKMTAEYQKVHALASQQCEEFKAWLRTQLRKSGYTEELVRHVDAMTVDSIVFGVKSLTVQYSMPDELFAAVTSADATPEIRASFEGWRPV